MKNRIRLDTMKDVTEFVAIVGEYDFPITITDNTGLRVNAKSVIGAIHAMEFKELWVESEQDIYEAIKPFVTSGSEKNDEFLVSLQ